jgi:hypothetical protein
MKQNDQQPNLPVNERIHKLLNASNNELTKDAARLSAAEISELLSLLIADHDQAEKNQHLYSKGLALILGLDEAIQLQAAGKSLTSLFANYLLESISNGDIAMQKRLSPLLVGMNPSVFAETLWQADDKQISVLKDEASTEPLQHHIGLLAQDLGAILDDGQKKLDSLYHQIQELPLTNLDTEKLKSFDNEAERLCNITFVPQQIINKALAIAWNTSRIDLITKLSSLNEHFHKYACHFNEPSANSSSGTINLHTALKDKLNSVFTEKANDDDAAIDALAHLSIWYIQDYWEIGLLPNVSNIEHLLASGNNANSLKGTLFETAKSNLEKIGLTTLKDLKEAHIYSKKALKEFIASKHCQLQ